MVSPSASARSRSRASSLGSMVIVMVRSPSWLLPQILRDSSEFVRLVMRAVPRARPFVQQPVGRLIRSARWPQTRLVALIAARRSFPAHRNGQGCAVGAPRSGSGLYREDEHPIIAMEKMVRCIFLSIFSSKESGRLLCCCLVSRGQVRAKYLVYANGANRP